MKFGAHIYTIISIKLLMNYLFGEHQIKTHRSLVVPRALVGKHWSENCEVDLTFSLCEHVKRDFTER